MLIPTGSWIVVADGKKALFLQNTGTAIEPVLHLIEKEVLNNPPTREQGTDRPGRYPSGGNAMSGVEQTDWHESEKSRFAKDVAKHLNKAAHADAFSDLFLIAPPSTIGDLQPELDAKVTSRLRAKIEKDLTNHPVPKIVAALSGFES